MLFALSIGAGYSVGARVDDEPTTSVAGPATSILPRTSASSVPGTHAPTSPPGTPAPTTTTTEPGPRRPTAEDPLRVVLAGDSVMAGLAPALKAAVEADGTSEVRFILTPSILRDPTVRFTWNQQLEQFNPEVIVMFVGTWESEVLRTGTGAASEDPAWQGQYEANVLDPWLQLITSRGASVIWIGNPPVANDDANRAFRALNEAYADLPSRWPSVTYLPAQDALNGPTPGYHDVITTGDGTTVRTRQIDGLHLCADGAALLAQQVVEELVSSYKATALTGWQSGPWRGDAVYPPASCPQP